MESTLVRRVSAAPVDVFRKKVVVRKAEQIVTLGFSYTRHTRDYCLPLTRIPRDNMSTVRAAFEFAHSYC